MTSLSTYKVVSSHNLKHLCTKQTSKTVSTHVWMLRPVLFNVFCYICWIGDTIPTYAYYIFDLGKLHASHNLDQRFQVLFIRFFSSLFAPRIFPSPVHYFNFYISALQSFFFLVYPFPPSVTLQIWEEYKVIGSEK